MTDDTYSPIRGYICRHYRQIKYLLFFYPQATLGLYSIWAVMAGAERAILVVDHAEDLAHARAFVRKNHVESRVTVMLGPLEEIELPVPEGKEKLQVNSILHTDFYINHSTCNQGCLRNIKWLIRERMKPNSGFDS